MAVRCFWSREEQGVYANHQDLYRTGAHLQRLMVQLPLARLERVSFIR